MIPIQNSAGGNTLNIFESFKGNANTNLNDNYDEEVKEKDKIKNIS